tara:strand:- start:144 stop:764 length:621 start_codon:yes stop_codon:yes gene_type:complete
MALGISSIIYLYFNSLNVFLVFFISLLVLLSIFKEFISDIKIQNSFKIKFRRYCSFLVHTGVVIMIMGVSFSSNFENKFDLTISKGEKITVNNLSLKLLNIYEKETDAKEILGANLLIKTKNDEFLLKPEQNLYKYEGNREINKETEVAIYSSFLMDYYLILIDKNSDNQLNLKLYINPLVSFLWLGCLISIVGGFLLIFRRVKNA